MSGPTVKQQHIYNGLFQVLAEHFPTFRTPGNAFDVPGFAKAMGKSHETAYRALRLDSLTPRIAESLIEFSRECDGALPLVWDDLIRFTLPKYEEYSALPSDSDETDFLG